jgi:hypothetical protein
MDQWLALLNTVMKRVQQNEGILWLDEESSASQGRQCSVELVSYPIYSYRAHSRVNSFEYNVSGTSSVPILRQNQFCLRIGTELVPETSYSKELTRLCAREDYIELCRRESFKTYIVSYPSVNQSRVKMTELTTKQTYVPFSPYIYLFSLYLARLPIRKGMAVKMADKDIWHQFTAWIFYTTHKTLFICKN